VVAVERGEHGPAVQLSRRHGVLVLSRVDHPVVAEIVPQPLRREQVKAGGIQPVVQVVAAVDVMVSLLADGSRAGHGR
jgi:hypothetical protein